MKIFYFVKMFMINLLTYYQSIHSNEGPNTKYSLTLGNLSSIISKPLRKQLENLAKDCGGHQRNL
jgi:hypothetical protein